MQLIVKLRLINISKDKLKMVKKEKAHKGYLFKSI